MKQRRQFSRFALSEFSLVLKITSTVGRGRPPAFPQPLLLGDPPLALHPPGTEPARVGRTYRVAALAEPLLTAEPVSGVAFLAFRIVAASTRSAFTTRTVLDWRGLDVDGFEQLVGFVDQARILTFAFCR